jgi:2-hydroxychromene-2-carboxylate isomerase
MRVADDSARDLVVARVATRPRGVGHVDDRGGDRPGGRLLEDHGDLLGPVRGPALEPVDELDHRAVTVLPPPVGAGADHVHAVDDPAHTVRVDTTVSASFRSVDRPIFFYDLGSPYAYLAAERVNSLLPVVPVWQPILLGGIWKVTGGASWAHGPRRAEGMAEVEARAERYGLQPLRWPPGWPNRTLTAMRAAIFAQRSGRAVAFSLAAFRQAFAAGRDLSDTDNVLIAAAACELHPKAVLKGVESRAVKDGLRAATDAALDRGVRGVPTLAVGDLLFYGDDSLEDAAAALPAGDP